jgi:hypothetical protein
MDKAAWIDAFVMTMSQLGSQAAPQTLVETAESYHRSYALSDPSNLARKRVEQFGLGELGRGQTSLDSVYF